MPLRRKPSGHVIILSNHQPLPTPRTSKSTATQAFLSLSKGSEWQEDIQELGVGLGSWSEQGARPKSSC